MGCEKDHSLLCLSAWEVEDMNVLGSEYSNLVQT